MWKIERSIKMRDAETLGKMAFKLYLKNGGSYFELEDAEDFMEQELDDNGDELTDEELVRTVAQYMLNLGNS